MRFRAGQTFLYPISDDEKQHLWVIATEPDLDGRFAIVSFTSLRGAKDQTVVLRKNEHPFIKWDTCICYLLAEVSDGERLTKALDAGSAKMHKDVSPELVALILDGFLASDFTKKRVRDFVVQYKRALRESRRSLDS